MAVSFSSVFGGCIPCILFSRSSSTLQTVGYSFFAAIFNVGWAATQVSHMYDLNLTFSIKIVLLRKRV